MDWGLLLEKEGVSELTEARKILQVESAALAAERATAKDQETLTEILGEMQNALDQGDKEAFLEIDLAFHAAIAESTHNAVLLRMTLAIRSLLRTFIRAVLDTSNSAESTIDHHKEIAEAIVTGDPDHAHETMERHLVDFESMILEQLN